MMHRLSTLVFTLLFLGAMFGGLFHMTMGMDMTGEMTGCPFTSQAETVCSMSALDHIGVWQSSFLAVVPSFALLLFAVVAAFIILAVAPNLLTKPKLHPQPLFRNILERTYSYSYRPLQELFSNGILHPKLF